MVRIIAGRGIALIALVIPLTGCIHDVAGVDQVLWEARLEATGVQPTATGNAAAISRARSTETGISIEGITEGTYEWDIRAGGCAQPGDLIGRADQYPALVVTGAGAASADGVMVSDRMHSGQSYHVAVRDTSGGHVACGDFTEWT